MENYKPTLKQKLCGIIFGHRPLHPTDRGLLIGSKLCDRWCLRCGKMVQIPLAEDDHYDQSDTNPVT